MFVINLYHRPHPHPHPHPISIVPTSLRHVLVFIFFPFVSLHVMNFPPSSILAYAHRIRDIVLANPYASAATSAVFLLTTAWLIYRRNKEVVQFNGSHIVITGGSSGIGLCIAHCALEEGARVTIIARDAKKLAAAETQLLAQNANSSARIASFSCDASDPVAIEHCFSNAEEALGPIDVLVNAAGGAQGGYFEALDPEALEHGMKANYFAQLHPAQAAFRRMADRDRESRGHICFVGSMASLVGVFGYSAYTPAKFAIRGLAEVLYYEGSSRNIGITIAYPPDTDTPGYKNELNTMPPESIAVSQGAGVFPPELVAQKIVRAIKRGQYRVSVGVDGKLLEIVSAGMCPNINIAEIILMPVLRIASAFYVYNWKAMIRRAREKRLSETKNIAPQ